MKRTTMTVALVSLVAIGSLMAFSGWPAVALLSGGQTLDVGERTVASLGVQLTAMAVYLWSGTESGLEWTQARKRMRLGLSDPVVTNRFLLWLLVMFFSFASLVGPVTGTFLGILVHESPVIQLGAATAGLACAVCLTLAFLPPRFYLARIEQPATA